MILQVFGDKSIFNCAAPGAGPATWSMAALAAGLIRNPESACSALVTGVTHLEPGWIDGLRLSSLQSIKGELS
jgi:hypothetical protein